MLRVIRAVLPASEEEQAAAAGGGGGAQAALGPAGGLEPWRQHAEHEGGVRVLTWAGLGRTSLAWCHRHGILYQVRRSGTAAQRSDGVPVTTQPCCQQPCRWPSQAPKQRSFLSHASSTLPALEGPPPRTRLHHHHRHPPPHAPTHAQGKLYLYEGPQQGARQLAAEAVWPDRRVVRVPPDKIGGSEHVVALCPGLGHAGRA